MQVRLSLRAEDDLERIADWVAASNPQAALDLVHRIEARLELLSVFPESAPEVPGYRSGYRRIVIGRYIVLYAVRRDELFVARILHGATAAAAP